MQMTQKITQSPKDWLLEHLLRGASFTFDEVISGHTKKVGDVFTALFFGHETTLVVTELPDNEDFFYARKLH